MGESLLGKETRTETILSNFYFTKQLMKQKWDKTGNKNKNDKKLHVELHLILFF